MAEKKRGPGRPSGSKNKKAASRQESKAREKAKEIQAKRKADRRVVDEIWSIIAIALGVFLIVAVFTHGAGSFGEMTGDFLKGILGFIAYILPFYLIIFGALLFARQTASISAKTILLAFVILWMLAAVNSVRFIDADKISLSFAAAKGFYETGAALESGGLFGMTLSSLLIKWLGVSGCLIFTTVVTLVCLLLIINTPVSRFLRKISEKREEKRLIKENMYLEREAGEEYGQNTDKRQASEAFDEDKKKEASLKKRNIKIVDGNQSSSSEASGNSVSSCGFSAEKGIKRDKNNVLYYMNDDSLFGETQPSGTYGLEEKKDYGHGFGITGESDCGAVQIGKNSSGSGISFGLSPEDESSSFSSGNNAGRGTGGSAGAYGIDGGSGIFGGEKAHAPAKTITKKEAGEAMLSKDEINRPEFSKEYKMPSVNLLEKSKGAARTNDRLLTEKARKLEETLKNFHVDARVVQVTQGPTVTRYEIQPSAGVKVSSIVRLANDIALNLEAKSIRIEAPIPGKAAVGIEVENDSVTMVRIRDIIDSQEFKESKSKITFAVGKDISGKAIVADLKAMPHLLIAGSTGSGKSVCINGIITSLLYKARPEEVKLILIDPKVVELGNYNGVPHLMIPVVTDPSKAAAALNWAVAEMTDRYKKFAEAGVRDLESYNEAARADEEPDKVMPQVVIIIDELADLMMAAPSQIEESICRLAQMARAAGMHLIVATQRPSVDVITGVIKANIPSRIAFAVSSQVDSRTILDMQGAEKLVGKGDMLFNPMGKGKPVRVQGAFISDGEVNKVIDFVKAQTEETEYDQDVLTRIEKTEQSSSEEETDELLPDAIELVVRSGQASVSMLQRRFRIGYNRAARIVEMMESRGIVSPQDGSRPRQVLITEEEYERMQEETEEI